MDRRWLIGGLRISLGLAIFGLGQGGILAAERIKFGTSTSMDVHFAVPLLTAERQGVWKKNGLDGEWVPFKGGAPMYRAVLAGAVPGGLSGTMSNIQALARGIPVVIVAAFETRNDFQVWVAANSPIKEPKDLAGARIGITRFGGMAHAYGVALAKGLGLERSIKFVSGGGVTEEIAAVRSGAINGTVLNFSTMLTLMLKGEARYVASVRPYLPKEWVDNIAFTRKDFIEKSPDVARRVVKTMLETGRFIENNPDWAVGIMKSDLGHTEEAARFLYKEVLRFGDGKIDRKAMENARNFLIEYKMVSPDKTPPVEELYTNKFTQ